MKKSYILYLFLGVLFAACSVDDDNIFGDDENAIVRAQKMIEECSEALLIPEHGWKMVYSPDTLHGGFAVLMKFLNKGEVEMLTDYLEEGSKSYYSFNISQGPVLNFDTYSCLHHLANPASEFDKGYGLYGEVEYVIQKSSADSIVFNGKKYGKRIVFYPAVESDWTDLMAAARLNIERLTPPENAPFFRALTMNQTAVNLIYDPNTRSLSYTYADDKTRSVVTASAGVYGTIDGVRLQPALNVNGVVLDQLKYNADEGLFEANSPGVFGNMKYSHKPPFIFYNSIKDMQQNSNIIGIPAMGKFSFDVNILFEIAKLLQAKGTLPDELTDGYPMMVLQGLKQVRITWNLDVSGSNVGPWFTYWGAENAFSDPEFAVHYKMDMVQLREDQLRFTFDEYEFISDDDAFRNKMESQPGFTAFKRFFSDPAGFTIVPATNNRYYFVNLADSRRNVCLTKE